jgi:hypothetical protein
VYIDNLVIGGLPDGAARTCSDNDRQSCDSDPVADGDSARIQHTNCYSVGFAITISFTNTNGLTHADNDIDTGRTIDANRHIHADRITYFDYA